MFVMAPGWAQAGSGFYISSDIGLNSPRGSEFTGAATTRQRIAMSLPIQHNEVEGFWADRVWNLSTFRTTPALIAVEDWHTDFDSATGILAGAAVGYSFAGQNPNGPLGGLRVELEYFYRESNYDQKADLTGAGESGDKTRAGIC